MYPSFDRTGDVLAKDVDLLNRYLFSLCNRYRRVVPRVLQRLALGSPGLRAELV